MGWKRKGNIMGIKMQAIRHHKKKVFFPEKRAMTRRELYKYMTKTQIANTHYYRIYRHKGRGYTLYKGPPKETHGGIRHRPTTKRYESRFGMTRKPKETKTKTKPLVEVRKKELPVYEVKRITKGRYKGSFKTKSGRILNETQFHTIRASNKDKYEFVVKD